VLMPKYQWDIADPLTCIEVVVGTGEVMRTGSAAGPGDIEEQWRSGGAQKEAAGPSAASWYRVIQGAQGTMGVVTWATARCEVLPRLESPFFVGASSIERLLPMVHWLIRLRLANECFILNARNFSLIASSLGLVDGMRMKREIPSWVLFFNLAAYDYLPEERLSGLIEDTMEISKDLGLEPQKVLWKLRAEDFLQSVRRPCPEPYWKLLFGGCEDVFFLARWEKIPGHLRTMAGLVERGGYPFRELGVYIQPLVQGTTYHVEFNLFFEARQAERVSRIARASVTALLQEGAFFSRPYGHQARMIVMRDAAQVEILKKVKQILDPSGIMNPGKLCF